MNLVKALLLTKGGATTFGKATHGPSEKLLPGGKELKDAYLDAYPSPKTTGELQVFAELHKLLLGRNVARGTRFNIASLLPQVLPGHRLWADAANKPERFISIHELRFIENTASRELWLELFIVEDDLSRFGITHKRFLEESGLSSSFREVKSSENFELRHLLCLEQMAKTKYSHRASDQVQSLVDQVKRHIWVTVNSAQPYRKYYAYLAPSAESGEVLPQLLSIYAISYYLGSITRYRPQLFDKILAEPFGPRIEEFVAAQPMQFIYLVASEFAEQEITRPALI